MIGQGVYSSPAPPAPHAPPQLIDSCISTTSSEVLAFCSSFIHTSAASSAPAPPAVPPPASEPRRLAKAPHPTHILKCPRCASLDTKFCYYNNYSLSQPRYFCKNCKRYWTAGGVLRNVPVGGGLRKTKRSKLKLAAEVEAAAAAARESAHQLQHAEGNPPSPVQVASACAMGSSATSANSSVVSGVPVGAAPLPGYPPPHDTTATHLPRTSSGSECSTIENAGNEGCAASAGSAAAFLVEQQQSCGQPQRFYGGTGVHAGRPQFYASYASTSLASSCNEQYSGTSVEEGTRRNSYHGGAVGYGSCPPPPSSLEQVVGSNRDGFKDNSTPSYDWQFIFNGGSWPDFSQFHDPTEPG